MSVDFEGGIARRMQYVARVGVHGVAGLAPELVRLAVGGTLALHPAAGGLLELRFGDRFHALRGESDGNAGDGGFIQRRVDDPIGAELFDESLGGTEDTAVDANVLAKHDDAWVVLHLPGQCLSDCFDQGDLSHGNP